MRSTKFFLALCAALVAAGCVTKQTYNTEVQKADSYAALSQKLQGELSADQAQITQLQNELKVTMVNEILFPEGGWSLSPRGEQALGKIAPTLSDLKGQQIVVQGFTDNVPIGPELRGRFPSNLELSSARADNVARFLTSKGVPQNTISAQGFGEARPVASNDTPQGRAKNRRVEIVISSASRP
ncbi:OmpA/MotB family protein [Variovorax saccharolyticus]|uniref:OmpA/MotB family protein n=1 Tax=Variovorax saccharolyticus TaxID=3053516 RepID=UPI002577F8F4|nr:MULTISPECIES: OmpA family protein [unclassified Variovorax]MDM0020894.1 OmpA family protein [Variovorax sp. J22R187]MDM0025245.1 OmpA family protein [Variovorax sp. J31P216]